MINIIERIAEIQKRAGESVCLMYGKWGWTAWTTTRLAMEMGGHATAEEAIARLDERLAKIEDRDGALARTLGIAA